MKLKSLIFFSFCLIFCGCTSEQGENWELTFPQEIMLSQEENEKLSYALEGVFYGRNWNGEWQSIAGKTPEEKRESRVQQEKFIFNLLNQTYEANFLTENAEDVPLKLDFQLREVDNGYDGEEIGGKWKQMIFEKSSLDRIIQDLFWVSRNEKIDTDQLNREVWIDGFLLSGEQYYFFNYRYYGENLIHNKGRGTRFLISKVQQESESDFSFFATYEDDALSGVCEVDFKAVKNPWSAFWYTVKEFRVQNCEKLWSYTAIPEGASPLLLGSEQSISKPEKGSSVGEKREISLDLNNDGIEEYFSIGYDSPNGSLLLGVNGDRGRNFVYDFTDEVTVTEGEEIVDTSAPQRIEFHFGDFDQDDEKEVFVAISNGKDLVEGVIYKLWGDEGFYEIGRLKGKEYFIFDEEQGIFYAPYAQKGLSRTFVWKDGKLVVK